MFLGVYTSSSSRKSLDRTINQLFLSTRDSRARHYFQPAAGEKFSNEEGEM